MVRVVVTCCLLLMTLVLSSSASETGGQDVLEELDDVLNQLSDILKNSESSSSTSSTSSLDQDALSVARRDKRYHGRGCPNKNMVVCPGSRVCVKKSQFCNGKKDCPRGMDERKSKCRRRPKGLYTDKRDYAQDEAQAVSWAQRDLISHCGANEIACGGSRGKCIPRAFLCDGYVDCYDDSWDESSDMCGEKITCSKGMIKCNNTNNCIYWSDLCNNIPDCEDHEDENEQNCGVRHCPAATTKCPNSNLCLENEYWCDDYKDCVNGEDEDKSYCQYVPCDGLRCTDGTCVPGSAYCDGVADCKDGTDEDVDRCGPVTCPAGSIRCKVTNSCVSISLTCDGIEDCPDGSDENEADCLSFRKEPSSDYYRRTVEDGDTVAETDDAEEDEDKDIAETKKRLFKLLDLLADK